MKLFELKLSDMGDEIAQPVGVGVRLVAYVRHGRMKRGLNWLLRRAKAGKTVDMRTLQWVVRRSVRMEVRR